MKITGDRFKDYASLKQSFDWIERETDIAKYHGWSLEDLELHACQLVDDCADYDAAYGGDSLSDLQGIK